MHYYAFFMLFMAANSGVAGPGPVPGGGLTILFRTRHY